MEGPTSEWYNDLLKSDLPDDEKREFVRSITVLFGQVNQMPRKALVTHLRENNLDTEGNREVLMKRLKNFYRKQKLASINITPTVQLAPYYLVLDFEATCNTINAPDYPHEIIEFPAVLVRSKDRMIIDTFQSYVRPEINPVLSDFCVQLTGITQATVDAAETFEPVLKKFEDWMLCHGLFSKHKCILVTDGPWDMAQFFHSQCKVSGVPYPSWAKRWLNIRKAFRSYHKKKMLYNLKSMLETLGLEFEGRQHCGLDDAKNIARILLVLMNDDVPLPINERLTLKDYRNREKALLSSATAIVQKRTNGVGELMERLKKVTLESSPQKDNSQETQDKEENRPGCSSESEETEGEDSILWRNNKFSALKNSSILPFY